MDSVKLAALERFKLIPIDKCVKAVWNYKNEDESLTEKLIENIKRNGQIENILVRELDTGFYEVVNGNHRLECMLRLGAKKVVAYDLGKMTEAQAQRIALETNETKYQNDPLKLAGIVAELGKQFSIEDLLQTMPYSQQEIENYIKMNSFDITTIQPVDEESSTGQEDKKGKVLSFQCEEALVVAWEEWKQRCGVLHPELITDESLFLKAISAALDHTEND